MSTSLCLRPSYTRVCGGGTASVFGKPTDFRGLFEKESLLACMVQHVRDQGVSKLLLPNVSHFNARIADSCELFQKKVDVDGVGVYTQCFVDGVRITKGQALFIASADCPTLVFSIPQGDFVVVCHAGKNSLLDPCRIDHSGKVRTHGSVVDRALEFFKGNKKDLRIDVLCGIGAQAVNYSASDQKYGDQNKTLISYVFDKWGGEVFAPLLKGGKMVRPSGFDRCMEGHLDFFALVRAQAKIHGVPHVNILSDGVCTYTDGTGSHGGRFWSHKRQVEGGVASAEGKRNGVLVAFT